MNRIRQLNIQLHGSTETVLGKNKIETHGTQGATDGPGKRTRQRERRKVLNLLRSQLAQASENYFHALAEHRPVENLTERQSHLDHVVGFVQGVVHRVVSEELTKKRTSDKKKPAISAQESKLSPPKKERTFVHSEVRTAEELSQEIARQKPELKRDANGNITPQSTEALRNFHPEVVLYSPQIPPNTGTVARLCAAFGARLHLVEPLGFEISSKALRRAGLDYWEFVDVTVHQSLSLLQAARPGRRIVIVETGGTQNPEDFEFEPGDLLVFGAETTGLPADFMQRVLTQENAALLTVPMFSSGVRSLNLANTVSIALYCAIAHLHKKFGH